MVWNLHNFQFSPLKAQLFSLVVFSFDVARDMFPLGCCHHKLCDHKQLFMINFPATYAHNHLTTLLVKHWLIERRSFELNCDSSQSDIRCSFPESLFPELRALIYSTYFQLSCNVSLHATRNKALYQLLSIRLLWSPF
jgi:hypothetical protein